MEIRQRLRYASMATRRIRMTVADPAHRYDASRSQSVSTVVGIIFLANSAITLASMSGVLSLERYFAGGPPNGWKLLCLTSLFAVVPTQIVLAAGWTAISQQPWQRRMMLGAGALIWIDVLLLLVEARTKGPRDFGGLVSQGFPALLLHGAILWLGAFALFRPLSIAWEFGNHAASGRGNQFRLLDIGEWTFAVALPLAFVQVLDSIGRWTLKGTLVCGLVVVCCVIVVVSGGLWRNRTVITPILAAAIVLADGGTLYLLHYFGYAQQTWTPTMLGGVVGGATCASTINLVALQLLGYRLRHRSRSASVRDESPSGFTSRP
jgi:hypothetical protein